MSGKVQKSKISQQNVPVEAMKASVKKLERKVSSLQGYFDLLPKTNEDV